jgi:hypothetical protein
VPPDYDQYSNQNSEGYHSQRHNLSTIDSITNDHSSNPSTTVSTFSVDFTLQQCLQYHQEQEYVRQQQQNDQKSEHLQDKSELNTTNTEDLAQIGSTKQTDENTTEGYNVNLAIPDRSQAEYSSLLPNSVLESLGK